MNDKIGILNMTEEEREEHDKKLEMTVSDYSSDEYSSDEYSDDEKIGASNFSYSGFEDMLLDNDRNSKYRKAIYEAIEHRLKVDGEAHVLDIGSGTGLLSLYAATAGATSVTAIELDPVIYKVSKKIAQRNNLRRKIKFINVESTELDKLPKQRANILISEIFDSELLGENVLRTFRHALQHLTTKDVICIPARADVYVVPIQSQLLAQQCCLPENLKTQCNGNLTPIDSHWFTSGKKTLDFASEPKLLKSFIFNDMESIVLQGSTELEFIVGKVVKQIDGVILWWDLDLKGDGELIITTGTVKDKPRWRNHWLPVAYGFTQKVPTKRKAKFNLIGSHDEVSFRFDIKTSETTNVDKKDCTCQWHSTISPKTFLRLNTTYSNSQFVDLVVKETLDKTVIVIGSHSLLPLFMKAKKIIVVGGRDNRFINLISSIYQGEIKFLASLYSFRDWETIECVVFDVYSDENSSIIDFINEYYTAASIPRNKRTIIPEKLELKTMPVKFENLWRRKVNVKKVDEFDYIDFYSHFEFEPVVDFNCDPLYKEPNDADVLELLPLYEEVCYSKNSELSHEEKSLFDFATEYYRSEVQFEIRIPYDSDAYIFYFVGTHDDKVVYQPFKRKKGKKLDWNEGSRQWIFFLKNENSNELFIHSNDIDYEDYATIHPGFMVKDIYNWRYPTYQEALTEIANLVIKEWIESRVPQNDEKSGT